MSTLNSKALLGTLALALLVGCGETPRSSDSGDAARAVSADVQAVGPVADLGAALAVIVADAAAPPAEEPAAEEPAAEEPAAEPAPAEPAPAEPAPAEPAPAEPAPAEPQGPFGGRDLYVDPATNYSLQADLWKTIDPSGADLMEIMADQNLGLWLAEWSGDITDAVDEALDVAGDDLQVLVAYNIPERDCGLWSAGGARNASEYEEWIDGFAAGIGGRETIVVLEPDALALLSCLDADGQVDRLAMIAYAVDELSAAGASVYIDAGGYNWIPADDMADALVAANVKNAAGFALNVSHTETTPNVIGYAEELRARVGDDAHYLVDTSRNGNGPNAENEWCNPLGVAVGELPTLDTDVDGLDGFLWVKPPGESDGECNGGPPAGHWWPEYAADMMEEAGY